MFSFFKKKKPEIKENKNDFDIELTASILAYEIARSDGEISESELTILLDEIKKISIKVGKEANKVLEIIEEYSRNSVSFYEFIDDINKDYSKDNKLSLIRFLYDVAYADKFLEVNEERLIRRIADMIKIKDIEVLKLPGYSSTYSSYKSSPTYVSIWRRTTHFSKSVKASSLYKSCIKEEKEKLSDFIFNSFLLSKII